MIPEGKAAVDEAGEALRRALAWSRTAPSSPRRARRAGSA